MLSDIIRAACAAKPSSMMSVMIPPCGHGMKERSSIACSPSMIVLGSPISHVASNDASHKCSKSYPNLIILPKKVTSPIIRDAAIAPSVAGKIAAPIPATTPPAKPPVAIVAAIRAIAPATTRAPTAMPKSDAITPPHFICGTLHSKQLLILVSTIRNTGFLSFVSAVQTLDGVPIFNGVDLVILVQTTLVPNSIYCSLIFLNYLSDFTVNC
ncbi:hypothetical protein M573_143004 [Prevotella intermedia ZT]|uniref:Uncharacterized protein n=1 Tax=Prevotella intermedia ZT TaxID=1347790 RepID=A0AAP0VGF0_PREIN|nr:hypothetical protein M573_143004 [Prevotella intermedia ZT]